MKKLWLFLLCTPLCLGQTHTFSTTDQPNVFTAPQTFAAGSVAGPVLVSQLPVNPSIGLKLTILDPSSTTDCTSGGGNQTSPPPHECYWNGFSWSTTSTSSLPVPLTIALGGTGTTSVCGTNNAVLIWGATAISCPTNILSTATGLQIGTPGTGFIDVPGGTSMTNPASGNCRLWFNTTAVSFQALTSTGANCLPSGSGGYSIQLGGSTFTAGDTVNFNNTTPANPSNSYVINFQTSKASTTDSVSAYFQGDGNSTDCATGTGWAACPGGGGGSATSQLLTTVNGGAAGCTGNVCTGNAADQVIFSFSVGNPGNGKCVQILGWYRTTTSSGGTKTIKVKLGSSAFAYTGYSSSAAGETELALQICNNQSSHTAQTIVPIAPITVSTSLASTLATPGTSAIDWSAGAQTIQIIQNVPATEVLTWDMAQAITIQ